MTHPNHPPVHALPRAVRAPRGSTLTCKNWLIEAAYRMVQKHAFNIGRNGGDLKAELLRDREVRRYLSAEEIETAWSVEHHLANVDVIFRRVFGPLRRNGKA